MDSPKLEIFLKTDFVTIAKPDFMPMFKEPIRAKYSLLTDSRTASDRESETFHTIISASEHQ